MHKNNKNEDVAAPEAIQRAKNLVEEFFGLKLEDKAFCSHETIYGEAPGFARPDVSDYYYCELMSPTGRTVGSIHFTLRRDNGWVSIGCDKSSQWEEALQIAIDNFVNNPRGGNGVLGDWRPTAEKLNGTR